MTPPEASLNRFQRWYFAWAQPHYERMAPAVRADVERIDRWLYSRKGLPLWLGLLAALGSSIGGLMAGGFPWSLAVACSLLVWIGLPLGALGAWLQPDRFTPRRMLRSSLQVIAGGYVGAFVGFLVGRIEKHGGLALESLPAALWAAAKAATPILLVALVAIILLVGGVAHVRRLQLQRQLTQLSLVQERDQAARQAAEARLRLLQAQIQPHFIFNTLAALQHWVDTADPRAGPLLHELTRFLRGSTELLGSEGATLAQEFELAQHYLAIQKARLGDRLVVETHLSAEARDTMLPPGLVLTLVENAVEHGIGPSVHGGQVRVRAHGDGGALVLRVEDSGVGMDTVPPDEGVGLRNSRERLRGLFGDRAQLQLLPRDGGGTVAEVRIAPENSPP
jgi:Histidine kinase